MSTNSSPSPVDGPQSRVGALLMQHRMALYGFIFSCVRHHADTEDLLQEVSLVVTQNIGKLRDEGEFLTWAIEIARRSILTHQRSTRRRPVLPPEAIEALAQAAVDVQFSEPYEARSAALSDCLDALPPQSRRLIQMRYDAGTGDVSSLASQIGRTASATYALLKRIRIALRECVERGLAAEGRT
jgi:RNA polymerase sigma-70 factor (ECF subfamily)